MLTTFQRTPAPASRLDPLQFGSPAAKVLAAATGDPREAARSALPQLTADLTDIPPEECAADGIDFLDERLGETGNGDPIHDRER